MPDRTRTVLVTGCSRGIGRATAIELHERGWDVVATARDARLLEDLPVKRTGAVDVTDADSVAAAAREWPDVEAVVNNAGIGTAGPVESTPTSVAQEILDVNVLGVLRTVAAFAPGMRARGHGAFVNLSSLVGRVAPPLTGVYAASKWALEGLSEALAMELGHFGVRVLLIEPGVVSTGAFEAFTPYFPDDDCYAPLAAHAQAAPTESSSPQTVARTIADLLEADAAPLRTPVGDAANQLLAARASMDDTAFGALARSVFTPPTWRAPP